MQSTPPFLFVSLFSFLPNEWPAPLYNEGNISSNGFRFGKRQHISLKGWFTRKNLTSHINESDSDYSKGHQITLGIFTTYEASRSVISFMRYSKLFTTLLPVNVWIQLSPINVWNYQIFQPFFKVNSHPYTQWFLNSSTEHLMFVHKTHILLNHKCKSKSNSPKTPPPHRIVRGLIQQSYP